MKDCALVFIIPSIINSNVLYELFIATLVVSLGPKLFQLFPVSLMNQLHGRKN